MARAFFSKTIKDVDVMFDMTTRQNEVFSYSQVAHAQDFIHVIPIDRLGQHMSHVEYNIILRYRLMIPLFPIDKVCPVCPKVCLNTF